MTAVDLLHRENDYHLLRTLEDPNSGTHWCFMHRRSSVPVPGYRPCFSTSMLKELRQYQLATSDIVRRPLHSSDSPLLHHLVLASDTDVFNLGGDLDLFCRLIRCQDRAALLAYARQCVEVAHGFHNHLNGDFHTIALVQGDALGGGFEAALSCQTIVAERDVGMGLPEVLFDLFPGMGAYSFLCKRVSPKLAEEMMLNGIVYSSQDLYKMGVVDVLVPKGEGTEAVHAIIKRNQRIGHARTAMNRVRGICQPVTLNELTQVVEVWVDTALQLSGNALRTMERLVRAQQRRVASPEPRPGAALQQVAG